MVTFVWLVAQRPMRGGLRCAKMMNGEPSAMMDGAQLMLKWPADNLDTIFEVHIDKVAIITYGITVIASMHHIINHTLLVKHIYCSLFFFHPNRCEGILLILLWSRSWKDTLNICRMHWDRIRVAELSLQHPF